MLLGADTLQNMFLHLPSKENVFLLLRLVSKQFKQVIDDKGFLLGSALIEDGYSQNKDLTHSIIFMQQQEEMLFLLNNSKKILTLCDEDSEINEALENLKKPPEESTYFNLYYRHKALNHVNQLIIEFKLKHAVDNTLDCKDVCLSRLPHKFFTSFKNQSMIDEIKYLNISKNNIKAIPESIERLNNVTYIMASDNKLTQLPKNIDTLVNLKWLYLAHNQLQQLTAEIDRLEALITLDVNHNALTSLPNNIVKLKNLRCLNGDFPASLIDG